MSGRLCVNHCRDLVSLIIQHVGMLVLQRLIYEIGQRAGFYVFKFALRSDVFPMAKKLYEKGVHKLLIATFASEALL